MKHVAHSPRKADALERAFRTFWQAVGIDIAAAIGVGMTSLIAQQDVTSGVFWAAFGLLIVKSVLTAVASYLVRLKVAPKQDAHAGAVG